MADIGAQANQVSHAIQETSESETLLPNTHRELAKPRNSFQDPYQQTVKTRAMALLKSELKVFGNVACMQF